MVSSLLIQETHLARHKETETDGCMETARLGKTGLEVSRVGMGGIPLTRPTETEAIRWSRNTT